MKITLLVGGGGDTYYELGLLSGLFVAGIHVDFIGSNYLREKSILKDERVSFYNLRGDQNPGALLHEKIIRILKYYIKLLKYAYKTDSKIFHIQWLSKFEYFDRIFVNAYFKLLGKKIVFTAHNVNARERDENDSFLNKLTLMFFYRIIDNIIVHTDEMKIQLVENYNIDSSKISVIPYGINNMV